MSSITTWCRIANEAYFINGIEQETNLLNEETSFLLKLYQNLAVNYPKFHKMDRLAKTALLGVELLMRHNENLRNLGEDEIALLFANSESSEYSDLKFQESYTIQNNPSPSHFVYTLPNTMIGEVHIKQKWFGEGVYLFQPKPDFKEIQENLQLMLKSGSNACIFAWVNVLNDNTDAIFYVIETDNPTGPDCTAKQLELLYTKNYDNH